jgi:hypothetical protein
MEREGRQEAKRERREEKKRKWARHQIVDDLALLAEELRSRIPDAKGSVNELRDILCQLEGLGSFDIRDWAALCDECGHRAEVGYANIRSLVVPILALLWERRDHVKPTPHELVAKIAYSFLYPDLKAAIRQDERVQAAERRLIDANSAIAEYQEAKQWRLRDKADTWKKAGIYVLLGTLAISAFGFLTATRTMGVLAGTIQKTATVVGVFGVIAGIALIAMARSISRKTENPIPRTDVMDHECGGAMQSLAQERGCLARMRSPDLAVICDAGTNAIPV